MLSCDSIEVLTEEFPACDPVPVTGCPVRPHISFAGPEMVILSNQSEPAKKDTQIRYDCGTQLSFPGLSGNVVRHFYPPYDIKGDILINRIRYPSGQDILFQGTRVDTKRITAFFQVGINPPRTDIG